MTPYLIGFGWGWIAALLIVNACLPSMIRNAIRDVLREREDAVRRAARRPV